MNDKTLTHFIEKLQEERWKSKVSALQVLERNPFRDERIIPYLEMLLTDKTPCIIDIPLIYGEIRWLAASALAAEYAATGQDKSVILHQATKPMKSGRISTLARSANIKASGNEPVDYILDSYRQLQERGLLPLETIEIKWPKDYFEED